MIGLVIAITLITLFVVVISEILWFREERASIRYRMILEGKIFNQVDADNFVQQFSEGYHRLDLQVMAVVGRNGHKWHCIFNHKHYVIQQDMMSWWMSDLHFLIILAASCKADVFICSNDICTSIGDYHKLSPNLIVPIHS